MGLLEKESGVIGKTFRTLTGKNVKNAEKAVVDATGRLKDANNAVKKSSRHTGGRGRNSQDFDRVRARQNEILAKKDLGKKEALVDIEKAKTSKYRKVAGGVAGGTALAGGGLVAYSKNKTKK
jgi:transposase-like protein